MVELQRFAHGGVSGRAAETGQPRDAGFAADNAHRGKIAHGVRRHGVGNRHECVGARMQDRPGED